MHHSIKPFLLVKRTIANLLRISVRKCTVLALKLLAFMHRPHTQRRSLPKCNRNRMWKTSEYRYSTKAQSIFQVYRPVRTWARSMLQWWQIRRSNHTSNFLNWRTHNIPHLWLTCMASLMPSWTQPTPAELSTAVDMVTACQTRKLGTDFLPCHCTGQITSTKILICVSREVSSLSKEQRMQLLERQLKRRQLTKHTLSHTAGRPSLSSTS